MNCRRIPQRMLPSRDRLLRVDLSAQSVADEPVPERWRRRYLGGKGLAARYLHEELEPKTDPLSPENPLVLALGPVSGLLPGEQRYAVVTKSPLTGTFLDSYAGGTFPETLAGALPDHLLVLVTGRADEPVRLVVEDGEAWVEPSDRWGAETTTVCREAEGAVACIGPAGEHGVVYATVSSTPDAEHHAGRGGAGTVMGSKRLKAVVARGDPPSGLTERRAAYERRYLQTATGRWLAASGTLETVEFADEVGVLSSRGWTERGVDRAADLGVDAARERARAREHGADDDTGGGGFRVGTDVGETVPRGATGMTMGAGLGVESFDAAAALGERCNRLGLDLISTGNAVAWAIRAGEEGVVDADYEFGDPEGARRLVERIAAREGPLADALAEGVAAAGEALGGGGLVPTVKGMELPAYDPRGAASMALAYATADRGGCHRRARPVEREPFEGPFGPDEAARLVAEAQDRRSLRWSLVADDFVGETLDSDVDEWLAAVGAPYEALDRAGERIWNLVRLFNVREGFDRAADTVPEPIDPAALDVSFEATLEAYYEHRGWDERGVPTDATLSRLGLEEVAWE